MDLKMYECLTERDVKRITKRALSTLRNDRHNGRGIPHMKFGKSVRYKLADVLEFMEKNRVETQPI